MTRIIIAGFAALFMIIGAGLAHKARGQDHHPPEHQQLHDQFYNTWLRPIWRKEDGTRTSSCCSDKDCKPAPIRYNEKLGTWEAFDDAYSMWIGFPANLLEENQPDPRESPDGKSHACIAYGQVLCAVRGSQY